MGKLLVLYEFDFDIVNHIGTITEDKLDEFIDYFIADKVKEKAKSNLVFEVIEIRKQPKNNAVYIPIVFETYKIEFMDGTSKDFPKVKENIGFEYFVVEEENINEFLNKK